MSSTLLRLTWLSAAAARRISLTAASKNPASSNRARRSFAVGTTNASKDSSAGLLLSDACVRRLQQLSSQQEEQGHKTALRISVEGGGCSGFQYKFDLEDLVEDLSEDDLKFEREGAAVVIDEASLEYLKGSTVDYHEELIRSAFRIVDNPVAGDGCSCGASFSIKID